MIKMKRVAMKVVALKFIEPYIFSSLIRNSLHLSRFKTPIL